MIPNAKLYKAIVSNDYQELRWDIEPIHIHVERIATKRKSNLNVVDNLTSKKFSAVYRVITDFYKPVDIKVNDKIEFEGYKGIVSYVEIPLNMNGRYYSQMIVGIE